MHYKYRITKYDPKNRNENGAYLLDDWTAISDIGKVFSGKCLTKKEYENVENNYLFAIESFLTEASIEHLTINSLEQGSEFDFVNGQTVNLKETLEIAKLSLREEIWCKLSINQNMYIHFGYDYYMYIGVSKVCRETLNILPNKGLFVESFKSPYL